MLRRDPARPPACQVALERFGLAGAAKGVAAAFGDQGVDPGEDFPILVDPRQVFGPGIGVESDFHGSMSSCSSPSPASSRAIPSIKCFAFAGDDSR